MSDTLLNNADASGVFYLPASRQPAIEKAARHAHFCLLKADLASCSAAPEALRQLGSAFHFPVWFGANFDALYDCLTDPNWQAARGHVLLLSGTARLQSSAPNDFTTLLEVFQAAADARRDMNTPFWVLIDTADPNIPVLPEA